MKPFDPQALTITVGGVPITPADGPLEYPPPRALYIAPDGKGFFDLVDGKGTTIARWNTLTGAVVIPGRPRGYRTTPRRAVDLINAILLENFYLVEASP